MSNKVDTWPQPWMVEEMDNNIIPRREWAYVMLGTRGWLWRLLHRKTTRRITDAYLDAIDHRDRMERILKERDLD